jgi:hypothetical protein
MNPQDNPLFTAYTLGELDFGQAREIHEALQANPSAAHELEQIEAVTDALRHGAPIPMDRLTPEQRHNVLHPTNLPRRMQPMMPRKPVVKAKPMMWHAVGTLLKAAAVIGLTGAAFFAGWHLQPQAATTADIQVPQPPKPEISKSKVETPDVVVEAPSIKATRPVVEAPKVTPAIAATPVSTPEKKQEEKPKAEPVVVAVTAKPAETKVAALPPLNLGFSMPRAADAAFASTTRQANVKFSLQPALIRPVNIKDPKALASPVKPAAKGTDTKPKLASELLIHSWQSEIATCPWNNDHRLLRIVIQLPADQAAVTSVDDASFPMQITFDPLAVKQFRLLCERHQPAKELRSAGTHVVWYEFQPNGAVDAKRESGRQIAAVTVPKARFTSQTIGPFDSNSLRVIDRGYTLHNAREDFVFETAVVGFGMLMRGTDQLGSLNHELVLDLATRAKSDGANGERTRFVKLVKDAQQAVGL